MINNETGNALIILKFFKKYKGCWFNARAISHELDIPIPTVKGILTILVSDGLIEYDKEYFYRFKENEQKMINAEEVRKYQKEQREKINVTSYILEIEEKIKEDMLDLSCTRSIYELDKSIYPEVLMKIKKILEDNGYEIDLIPSSHYYEFGGIGIKWGRL